MLILSKIKIDKKPQQHPKWQRTPPQKARASFAAVANSTSPRGPRTTTWVLANTTSPPTVPSIVPSRPQPRSPSKVSLSPKNSVAAFMSKENRFLVFENVQTDVPGPGNYDVAGSTKARRPTKLPPGFGSRAAREPRAGSGPDFRPGMPIVSNPKKDPERTTWYRDYRDAGRGRACCLKTRARPAGGAARCGPR